KRKWSAPYIIPAGERAGDFLDILFGIVWVIGDGIFDPHREQLLELTRKVFVWSSENVCDVIQPDQHRRVLRNFEQQIVKAIERALSQQEILIEHQKVLDL